MDSYERRKKSDKAEEKKGRPSAIHARLHEALMEKKASAPVPVKPGKKK
jgi:hypothetical protein